MGTRLRTGACLGEAYSASFRCVSSAQVLGDDLRALGDLTCRSANPGGHDAMLVAGAPLVRLRSTRERRVTARAHRRDIATVNTRTGIVHRLRCAPRGIRTPNRQIRSLVLYPLS